MSVAFDAASFAVVNSNAGTTLAWTHTPVGSPSSVGVALRNYTGGGVSVTGVTYGSNPLTKNTAATSGTIGLGDHTEIWGSDGQTLATGAQTVTVTFSGTGAFCDAGAQTVTGSDTTTCFSNANAAIGSSTTPSVTVTSAAGELVIDIAGNDNNDLTLAPGGSQTLRWNTTASAILQDSGSSQPGAASVTMSWTGANNAWSISAASFKAAGSIIPAGSGFLLNSDPPIPYTKINHDKFTWNSSNNIFIPKKRVFLTSGTTWVVPADYNRFNNQIECIGGGAGGDAVGGAGGGGAYASIFNLNLSPGGTAVIQVGAAGSAGNPGTDTWLKSTSTVLAKGGGAPTATTGGPGGDSGASVGFSTSSGGPGGSVATGNPGGGGGAGGPRGGGGNGGNGGVSLGGNGGSGDNGFGGTGGTGSAAGTNPGNPGTEYDATHGSGGGGGGSITNTGGAAGNYGAGGGGSLVTGGAGAPGLIIITYTPATVDPLGGWALNSDPPIPPGPLKQLFQSDLSLRFLSPASPAAPISGMAWWRPVENPSVKGSSVNIDRHTGSTQPITFVLAGISGMAWWKEFNQPKFGPVSLDKMTNPPSFGVTTFLAPISGMAWWMPFVQPFFPTSAKYWEHQTELMAPPLATIYVMASTSDDQPQAKTGQRAWLSPQPASTFNTPAPPVDISGMAWYQNFDQPRFQTSFKPEEYPSFFATIIQGTLPTTISGMAWYGAFDQPRFSTAYSASQQSQEAFAPQNFVTIADVAWYKQFEQPRFSTAYQTASQPSEAFAPPPFVVTGIGWYVNLDQPFFRNLYQAYQQPQPAFDTALPVLPAGIAGIPWHRNFEQPFFLTSYKSWLQPSFFEDLTPATDPVGISGMAWWRPAEQPFFKTAYKSELLPGSFIALTPSTLPPGIAGMAWYQPFVQPKVVNAINPSVQSYTTGWFYLPGKVTGSLLQPIRISIGVDVGISWTRGT